MATSLESVVEIRARGEAMAAWARTHGVDAFCIGVASMRPAVVVVSLVTRADGRTEEEHETVYSVRELRSLLGY